VPFDDFTLQSNFVSSPSGSQRFWHFSLSDLQYSVSADATATAASKAAQKRTEYFIVIVD